MEELIEMWGLPARVRYEGVNPVWAAPDDVGALRVRLEACFAIKDGFLAFSDAVFQTGKRPWWISVPHVLCCGDCFKLMPGAPYSLDWKQILESAALPEQFLNPRTAQDFQQLLNYKFANVLDSLFRISRCFSKNICVQTYADAGVLDPGQEFFMANRSHWCRAYHFNYVSQDGYFVFSLLLADNEYYPIFPQAFLQRMYKIVRPVFIDELQLLCKTDPALQAHFEQVFLPFHGYFRVT